MNKIGSRKLKLSPETLRVLTPPELSSIHGGATTTTTTIMSIMSVSLISLVTTKTDSKIVAAE